MVTNMTGLTRIQTPATRTDVHPRRMAFSNGFTNATAPAPIQHLTRFMAAVAVPELSRLRSTTRVLRAAKEPDMQKVERKRRMTGPAREVTALHDPAVGNDGRGSDVDKRENDLEASGFDGEVGQILLFGFGDFHAAAWRRKFQSMALPTTEEAVMLPRPVGM